MIKKSILYFALIFSAFLLSSVTPLAVNPFRIFPYLQVFDQGQIQFTWFGNSVSNSSIKILDDTGNELLNTVVKGELISEFYYTSQEKNQEIPGLEQGSWLKDDQVVRYKIQVDLPAGIKVNYTVELAGETFSAEFKSPNNQKNWDRIRFIVLSDSETDPAGRVTNRTWYPGIPLFRPFEIPQLWKDKFGTTVAYGMEFPNYMLTEQQGYAENLKIINSRAIDFMIMPGDLVQGGGYQPGWDEFFRHNAGEFNTGLSRYPIIPALGNWEAFGAVNGGYQFNERGKFLPVVGRSRFHAYFETPSGDPLKKHKQSYYRADYGPVTVLTLDSSNGIPDQKASDFAGQTKLSGTQMGEIGTDTQENYTQAEYEANGGTDLSSFDPGSDQYIWLEENLKNAKELGQLIFVQYHHIAYSSGEHGVPLNHELTVGQVGTPLRILNPLLEEYGVIAVFSGHDEIFERSFVDENGDGKGIHYYDVGVAGDGMRGEKRDWLGNPQNTLKYNQYRKWTADQNSEEQWNKSGSVPMLEDGGKHYGHLEVNIEKLNEGGNEFAMIHFSPVYAFPVLDANYNLLRVERRVYSDEVRLKVLLKKSDSPPKFKEKVELELGEDGKVQMKPEDFLESMPEGEYTYTSSGGFDFTCADLGVKALKVKAKNKTSGEEWEANIEVVVLDKLSPVIQSKNYVVNLDRSLGGFTLSPEDFISSLTDNCGAPEVTVNKAEVTCEDIGKEIPIAIRARDASGNVTEAKAFLIVESSNSKPASISGTQQICIGKQGEVSLASDGEFEVVRWRRNGEEIPGETEKKLVVEQEGAYHAVIRYTGGCLAETEKFEVKVNPLPEGKILDEGNKLYAPEGPYSYRWFRNAELLTGETERVLEVNQMGEYEVELTNEFGRVTVLESKIVTVSGIGSIWVAVEEELLIYPNPASSLVQVKLKSDQILSGETMRIYSMEGADVTSSVEISRTGRNTYGITLNWLAQASYLVVITSDDRRTFIGRIVKK